MADLVVLIIIAIVYVVFKAFEGTTKAVSGIQNHKKFQDERNQKFNNRKIDTSKDLFDRNFDIIQKFAEKIEIDSYRSYYIDNLTRDCINEICLAENQTSIQPGHSYLSTWKSTASNEWATLAKQIMDCFEKTKQQLRDIMGKLRKAQADLKELILEKIPPKKYREIVKQFGSGDIFLENIDLVLSPSLDSWENKEQQLINKKLIPQIFPTFVSSVSVNEIKKFNQEVDEYNRKIQLDIPEHEENSKFFEGIRRGFREGVKNDILRRVEYILNDIKFPSAFPKFWDADYDSEQSILIIELSLPDVVHRPILKKVELKTKIVEKPLTKKEVNEYVPKIHPAIILRVAYEVFRNDESGVIKLLVLNGWVEYDNTATGLKTKTYTSSLVVTRDQILGLNLQKLDPLVAFLNLKGKSAGALVDIIPVTPTMSLNKKDKRFIETKEVLNNLGNETNLASMDWQDFESLIAELFQKEFAEKGAEVKVTQSSRDRGVDAVIFDPDPIKGGKFVVQAKRYTKTVDVSAVRDLCAVVQKEGASRGILVTTSSYGPDAYTFAQNEPITLLNGAELLGLLAKHGYKFRISIAEARKLLKDAVEIQAK